MSPLDRGREVANERFKPDIETFTVPTRQGDRDAPVEVTRDGAPLQTTLEIGEVEDTGAPVLGVLVQIAPQGGCEGSEIEEPMLSLAQHRTTPIDPAARLQQVSWVKLCAALVALISPSVAPAAQRACTLYITVGQEVSGAFRVELHLLCPIEIAGMVEAQENLLRDTMMIFRSRYG